VAALFLCFGSKVCFGSKGSATEDFVRQPRAEGCAAGGMSGKSGKIVNEGFHRGWIISGSGKPHIRAAGFTKTIDTEDSFRNALPSLIDHKLLPPAAK
jgi:hypothetical protein